MATGVDAKLLKSTKFPPEFNQKVDMQKVNIQVMKKWIASKVTEILANEDDVVIELVFNLLESGRYPDIKSMQIQLTGFLDKDTPTFCKDLWKLLLSAQTSPQGVPKELLEAKKMELIQEKLEADKAAEEARKKRQEFERRPERGRGGRGGGMGGGRGDSWRGGRRDDRDPRGNIGREEDSEIHMFPEEAQQSDVVEDDGTTGDDDPGLGRRLCGRGPALARGHPALAEAGGDRISVSGHHRHGADPDTGGAPDLGLARFHPIVVLAPPNAAATPLPLVGAKPDSESESQSKPDPESEPEPVEDSKQALQSVRIVYWIFSPFPIAKPHPDADHAAEAELAALALAARGALADALVEGMTETAASADDSGAQDRIRSPHDTTSAAEADQNVRASYEQRQRELKEKIKQMRSSRSAEGDHEANQSF
ncbi:hypothetical protein B0H65DRAFT_544293 [Neurospora tetraspora]|uniref:PWI domain-containing protein n=1 Tax=Neurospora tetraspora TaxID=94610 RepID=A0AAE0MWI3_9PEZI|nr:hypothetical protein B0H65DRAFT_544293 [Neurospora tetraspora]